MSTEVAAMGDPGAVGRSGIDPEGKWGEIKSAGIGLRRLLRSTRYSSAAWLSGSKDFRRDPHGRKLWQREWSGVLVPLARPGPGRSCREACESPRRPFAGATRAPQPQRLEESSLPSRSLVVLEATRRRARAARRSGLRRRPWGPELLGLLRDFEVVPRRDAVPTRHRAARPPTLGDQFFLSLFDAVADERSQRRPATGCLTRRRGRLRG